MRGPTRSATATTCSRSARPGRYTAQHTVTQAEIDGNGGGDGDIDNTATADSDQTGPASDDALVPVTQTPPTGGDATTLALDEEALGPGNPNATGSNPSSTAETAFDTLSFTAGSSPLTTFAFSNVLSGLIANTDGAVGNELVWVKDSAAPDYRPFLQLKWWPGRDHLDADAPTWRLNWRFHHRRRDSNGDAVRQSQAYACRRRTGSQPRFGWS